MDTDPTSGENTASGSSDLPDLDSEDGEVNEEEGVTGNEEEEEAEEEQGNEEEGNEEEGHEEGMRKLSRFQTMTRNTD